MIISFVPKYFEREKHFSACHFAQSGQKNDPMTQSKIKIYLI